MKKIILSLVAICLAESLARILGFGHPLLYIKTTSNYEVAPNQNITRLFKHANINALGLRGPAASIVPREDELRILVIGDSVAFGGSQVDDDETWPRMLEARLNSGKPNKFEVLNASTPGWAVRNEVQWLADHGTLGAKIILLNINEFDLYQPFVPPMIVGLNVSYPSRNPPLALIEVATRYVLPRLGLIDPGRGLEPSVSVHRREYLSAVLRDLAVANRYASRSNAALSIVYWDSCKPKSVAVRRGAKELFTLAQSLEIDVIRPQQGKAVGCADYRDEIHPNVDGNLKISSVVADHLANSIPGF